MCIIYKYIYDLCTALRVFDNHYYDHCVDIQSNNVIDQLLTIIIKSQNTNKLR